MQVNPCQVCPHRHTVPAIDPAVIKHALYPNETKEQDKTFTEEQVRTAIKEIIKEEMQIPEDAPEEGRLYVGGMWRFEYALRKKLGIEEEK
jgi:hypothetical protein